MTWRNLGSKVVVTLATLWLFFAVLHEVLTGRVWFWVLPGMSPPILFAVVPVCLALAALAIKRSRLLALALAMASFIVSLPSTGINFNAFFPSDTPPRDGASVSIVQMNTDYWGQMRDGILTDPRDKDAMLTYLRKLDADVYLLQEHMARKGDFARPITDLSDVTEIFPEYRALTAGTLLTLTRLPVLEHRVVNPDDGSGIRVFPPPYALRVDIQIEDRILSTYNVHMPVQVIIEKDWFSADFYYEIWRRHLVRQDEFRALTKDVIENPQPTVIAGDFNTSPAMGDNRRLLEVTTDAAAFSDHCGLRVLNHILC